MALARDDWDRLFDELYLCTYARVDRGELRRVLRSDGALVVETMHRDRLMSIFQPGGWDPLPDGDLLVEERRFDHAAGEIETTHTLVEANGNRESITYRLRVYTATELIQLLEQAGFTSVEAYGGLEREELSQRTRLVLLARV